VAGVAGTGGRRHPARLSVLTRSRKPAGRNLTVPADRRGFEVAGEFVDYASGTRNDRPQINDLRRKRRSILPSIPRVRRKRRGMRPEEIQPFRTWRWSARGGQGW
jgi:hypothetical protein